MIAAPIQMVAALTPGPPRQPSFDGPPGTVAATADAALQELHRMYSKALFNYLVKLTLGDRRAAEDITQETFVRAWNHLQHHHDTDLESFRPWLYTVARRLVVDMLRARRSRPVEVIVDDLTQLSDANDSIGSLIIVQVVREALMRLPPMQRALLVDLYYHGRTPTEVAEKLNIPVGTVKSRTYYAKRALRSSLDQQGFRLKLAPPTAEQAG
jgi:RNA polymerase sigma-70 factor (ECF subfamily)